MWKRVKWNDEVIPDPLSSLTVNETGKTKVQVKEEEKPVELGTSIIEQVMKKEV